MRNGGLVAWELCCRRGDRWLFHGVDLALAAGGALWIRGPNGAGKTSLMRILAGLLAPTPTGYGPPVARVGSVAWTGSLALIDERAALDGEAPLARALGFWAAVDGAAPDALAAAMARVGLAGLEDVPVRYLSTGQRKRAALARLAMAGADNWLLDEPLNGLDTGGVVLVAEMIAGHRAEGGTVIVASHQPIELPEASALEVAYSGPQWTAAEWADGVADGWADPGEADA